jgi:hypothetical protein
MIEDREIMVVYRRVYVDSSFYQNLLSAFDGETVRLVRLMEAEIGRRGG